MENLLAQRTEYRQYHDHKENVVYLGLALTASAFIAASSVLTSKTFGPGEIAVTAALLVALWFNQSFLRRQLILKKMAAIHVEATGAAIDRILAKGLSADELVRRDMNIKDRRNGRIWTWLGRGYDDVRAEFRKKKFPTYLADEIEATLINIRGGSNSLFSSFFSSPQLMANLATFLFLLVFLVSRTACMMSVELLFKLPF